MLTYTIAMLDSDKSDEAINTISNVEAIIKRLLKKRKKEVTVPDDQQRNSRKRRKSQEEDNIDLHFELLNANCIVMSATLQLLRANWIDHIKAAYDFRKALLIYEKIFESTQGVSVTEYKSVFNNSNHFSSVTTKTNNNSIKISKQQTSPSPSSPSTQEENPFIFDNTLESGAYFGIGLFSLIFALLPPKGKR